VSVCGTVSEFCVCVCGTVSVFCESDYGTVNVFVWVIMVQLVCSV
jgi:hypothetical protein